MGKIWIEVCLISARGLRRTSSLWKLQWYAVGWIDPNNKYCTKIDSSGNGNPVWKTKFSTAVDASETTFQELALQVEVYSREPIFLRPSLLGTATVVLKEFMEKYNAKSEVSKPVEEVGSFQLRKKNSNKPQGFVDVSIRVSEEREEPGSSYSAGAEGFDLTDHSGGINLATGYGSMNTQRPNIRLKTSRQPETTNPISIPTNYPQTETSNPMPRNYPHPETSNPVRAQPNYLHPASAQTSNSIRVQPNYPHPASAKTSNPVRVQPNYPHLASAGGTYYPEAGGPSYQPSRTPPSAGGPDYQAVGGTYYPEAGGPSYQPSRTPPPPPPPSNVGYIPNFFPRADNFAPSYINMPSSVAPPGRRGGPGFATGAGVGALAAGAVIFGDDFLSGFDVPSGLGDASLTMSTNPPF